MNAAKKKYFYKLLIIQSLIAITGYVYSILPGLFMIKFSSENIIEYDHFDNIYMILWTLMLGTINCIYVINKDLLFCNIKLYCILSIVFYPVIFLLFNFNVVEYNKIYLVFPLYFICDMLFIYTDFWVMLNKEKLYGFYNFIYAFGYTLGIVISYFVAPKYFNRDYVFCLFTFTMLSSIFIFSLCFIIHKEFREYIKNSINQISIKEQIDISIKSFKLTFPNIMSSIIFMFIVLQSLDKLSGHSILFISCFSFMKYFESVMHGAYSSSINLYISQLVNKSVIEDENKDLKSILLRVVILFLTVQSCIMFISILYFKSDNINLLISLGIFLLLKTIIYIIFKFTTIYLEYQQNVKINILSVIIQGMISFISINLLQNSSLLLTIAIPIVLNFFCVVSIFMYVCKKYDIKLKIEEVYS